MLRDLAPAYPLIARSEGLDEASLDLFHRPDDDRELTVDGHL